MIRYLLLFILWLAVGHVITAQALLKCQEASISFVSNAPLELIQARSTEVRGLLNEADGTFAFQVSVKTFEGFNNRVQREHFMENYMETSQYPQATFTGRIIEDINDYEILNDKVRAKGVMNIHGMKNEVLIEVHLNEAENGITFESELEIDLVDYDIKIPQIVKYKIAERIAISVNGLLVPQS